jgi:Zinc carboxypeptidase
MTGWWVSLLLAVYRPSADVVADLRALADMHPDIAHVEVIGRSVRGTEIIGLRIGDDSLPGVRFVGGHHGDEPPGVEMPLLLARHLLEHRDLLLGLHLFIVPLANPDGFDAHTRTNAHDVDVNRNYAYGYAAGEYQAGAYALSEPETRALAFDNELHRYGLSLTFHAGAYNIGYPMNYTTTLLPSDTLFSGYAEQYRGAVPDDAFWVTRGSDWYVSHGDLNDHSLGFYGGADFTVEVSSVKAPSDEGPFLEAMLEPSLTWLTHTRRTAQVFVRDALTHAALPATVATSELTGTCDPLRGEVELQIGTATTLLVTAPGYEARAVDATPGTTLVELRASHSDVAIAEPYVQSASEALSFSVATSASGAWLFRPGQNALDMSCHRDGEALRCERPAEHVLPGHYALILEGEARETFVANGVYLSADDEGLTAENATQVWFVTRGGAARLPVTGEALQPTEAEDLWLAGGGSQRLLTTSAAPKKQGCASTEMPVWMCVPLIFAMRTSPRSERKRDE